MGTKNIPPQITKEDIYQYANQLIDNLSELFDLIAQLVLKVNDDYEFEEILKQLARLEVINLQLQKRKWRALLVKETLDNINDNYLEGIFELNELWVSLGIPDDSPHIIQGINNSITPEKYYTNEMFKKLFNLNKK